MAPTPITTPPTVGTVNPLSTVVPPTTTGGTSLSSFLPGLPSLTGDLAHFTMRIAEVLVGILLIGLGLSELLKGTPAAPVVNTVKKAIK